MECQIVFAVLVAVSFADEVIGDKTADLEKSYMVSSYDTSYGNGNGYAQGNGYANGNGYGNGYGNGAGYAGAGYAAGSYADDSYGDSSYGQGSYGQAGNYGGAYRPTMAYDDGYSNQGYENGNGYGGNNYQAGYGYDNDAYSTNYDRRPYTSY